MSVLIFLKVSQKYFLKIYFILDRWDVGGGGGRAERRREILKQIPHWVWSLMQILSQDPEIMTWAEIKSRGLIDSVTQVPQQ